MFTKAGDNKAKEGLKVEEATGEREKGGLGDRFKGLSLGLVSTALCFPGCKYPGVS